MTITVTLSKPADLSLDQQMARIRRAAEIVEGMGWLFDEHISSMTQQLLDTVPNDIEKREELYYAIRAAVDLKGRLAHIVNDKPLVEAKIARMES